MAPNLVGTSALFIAEATNSVESLDIQHQTVKLPRKRIIRSQNNEPRYHWDIVWRNVFGMIYLHVFSIYGFYLFFTIAMWRTFFFNLLLSIIAGQGITAGAHRLWAHRCYKAKLPLRILLAFCQTVSFQNHIYEWVRDHRVHHKFTDTDADPHNAKRGFFFSHMGWLLVRKHKDVFLKGKTVDMSDLLEDPVVRFQMRFYLILMPICCFILPTVIPFYFWNENLFVSWYSSITRYTFSLHCTWLVNSAAHIYGTKPYDKTIGPTENKFVSTMALGEGWHNYHHIFPWDYKASELGYNRNLTTSIIDWFAKYGWAYDLKTVSKEIIEKRVARTGDGTRPVNKKYLEGNNEEHSHSGEIWGWGDKDMKEDDVKLAQIHHRLL